MLNCNKCGSPELGLITSVREVWTLDLENGTLGDMKDTYQADDGEDVFFCHTCHENIDDEELIAALCEKLGWSRSSVNSRPDRELQEPLVTIDQLESFNKSMGLAMQVISRATGMKFDSDEFLK